MKKKIKKVEVKKEVKDCIDTKREHGKEIDKQALAICYSECGN